MAGALRVTEVGGRNPIVIKECGMVSSLGLGCAASCAAARAGLRRAQPLDYLGFASLDGRDVEFAVGHPAPIVTHGFEGAPRLAQLVAAALRDLASRATIPTGPRAGFYLSLPSCRRHLTGAELIPDPIARQTFLEEVAEAEIEGTEESWVGAILSLALQQIGIPAAPIRFVSCAGHTGFAEALEAATGDLGAGAVDAALVGAGDSLVEERALGWLRLTARLKTGANPAGLEPGEGAAFFLLERGSGGCIAMIATDEEEGVRFPGDAGTGQALARCFNAVAREASGPVWLITDHNGETNRAMELGNFLARTAGPDRTFASPLYPAASFGDTSAASGGMALCLARAAFSRKYAPASAAVIASAADGAGWSALSVVAG